jgi:hypothetical protein
MLLNSIDPELGSLTLMKQALPKLIAVTCLCSVASLIPHSGAGAVDESRYMQCYWHNLIERSADMWYSIQYCLEQEGVKTTQNKIKEWVFNSEEGRQLLKRGRDMCIEWVGINIPEASHLGSQFCSCVDKSIIAGKSYKISLIQCGEYYDKFL